MSTVQPSIQALLDASVRAGFCAAGVVDLDLARTEFEQDVARFDAWLAAQYHDEMTYLPRGRDRRANPTLLMAEARSVLCVALPYAKNPIHLQNAEVRHARYLEGEDYHSKIPRLLESALKEIKQTLLPELEWRVAVDSSAVLERTWGRLTGIGWIGKNTMLIHPRHGSYTLLGVALLNIRTGQAPVLHPNYCGNCRECLDACPTQAFVMPQVLDARKCISNLTLEKRTPISEELSKKMDNWVAGCDICQEVCPFNRKPEVQSAENALLFPLLNSFEALDNESDEAFKLRAKKSALSRIKPTMWRRNLMIAKSNRQ